MARALPLWTCWLRAARRQRPQSLVAHSRPSAAKQAAQPWKWKGKSWLLSRVPAWLQFT